MAFVSGLMGPYMSPIPINASMGMLLSLAIAFVVTPWLARLWMKLLPAQAHTHEGGHRARIEPAFTRLFAPLLDARAARVPASCCCGRRGGADRGLAGAAGVRPGGAEDAALRQQVGVPGGARHAGRHAAGAAPPRCCTSWPTPATRARGAPTTGLRRHGRADQLQRPGAPVLPARRRRIRRPAGQPGRQAPPQRRATPSPRACARAAAIGARHGANVKVVEVPPGPPVLAPLVAEIYGPTPRPPQRGRRQCARCSSSTDGVVDVDDSGIADAPRQLLLVDRRKAAMLAWRSRPSSVLRAGLGGEA
jgi:hypothetical protein